MKLLLLVGLLVLCSATPQMVMLEYKELFERMAVDHIQMMPGFAEEMKLSTKMLKTQLPEWENFRLMDIKIVSFKMREEAKTAFAYFKDTSTTTITVTNPFDYHFEVAWMYDWYIFPFSGTAQIKGNVASLVYSLEFGDQGSVSSLSKLLLEAPNDIADFGKIGSWFDADKFVYDFFIDNIEEYTKSCEFRFSEQVAKNYTNQIVGNKAWDFFLPKQNVNMFMHQVLNKFVHNPSALTILYDQQFHPNAWNKLTVGKSFQNPKTSLAPEVEHPINTFVPPVIMREYVFNEDAVKQIVQGVWGESKMLMWDNNVAKIVQNRLDVWTLEKIIPDVGLVYQSNPNARVRLTFSGVRDMEPIVTFVDKENIHVDGLVLYASWSVGEHATDISYPLSTTLVFDADLKVVARGKEANIYVSNMELRPSDTEVRGSYERLIERNVHPVIEEYSKHVFPTLIEDGVFGYGLHFKEPLPYDYYVKAFFEDNSLRIQMAKIEEQIENKQNFVR
eukprot:TRINITY_DN7138_c0_g1_i1.p1 TRINITY_DN7138_c0_g1~~TRINITY_DN7138_c0_g1_i1.p1  ORF type:complete len:510 (+),score=77.05 TRINITY_DN7138_c0_g1_i1:22-1530(+)